MMPRSRHVISIGMPLGFEGTQHHWLQNEVGGFAWHSDPANANGVMNREEIAKNERFRGHCIYSRGVSRRGGAGCGGRHTRGVTP